VVYPWPALLAAYDPDNRQVAMWRELCARNCKKFINLFPAFDAEKAAHPDWYERLYIFGDFHFSAAGNRVMFRELAKELL
jgi:lysophospholipase L1-like esterase